jgi:hypothetical protein
MSHRSYTWGTARVGNLGYVKEECWEGETRIYSREFEMQANVVPAFVEARRRVIAMEMEAEGRNFIHDLSGGIH